MNGKTGTRIEAAEVYQAWLDVTSAATLAGDIETCFAHASLPYLYMNQTSRVVIETAEDFAQGIEGLSQKIRTLGANQFVRLTTGAEYLSAGYIAGSHVTHILRNAQPLVPSYDTRMVLRRGNDRWKVTEITSLAPQGLWPTGGAAPEPVSVAQPPADIRREAQDPLALYQRFLNLLTRTNVENDFDTFCGMMLFPHTGHGDNFDLIVNGPDDLRRMFDWLSDFLRQHEVEEFLRIASHAEFIAGDMICGYHTAHFLRDGRDFRPPVKSRMILRRNGARWFMQSVTNAVENDNFADGEPIACDTLVTHRKIQERTKKWPNLH